MVSCPSEFLLQKFMAQNRPNGKRDQCGSLYAIFNAEIAGAVRASRGAASLRRSILFGWISAAVSIQSGLNSISGCGSASRNFPVST